MMYTSDCREEGEDEMSPLSQIIMNIYVDIYQRIRMKADRYRDGAKNNERRDPARQIDE